MRWQRSARPTWIPRAGSAGRPMFPAEAMAHDGVKKETVKVFVLDREFSY